MKCRLCQEYYGWGNFKGFNVIFYLFQLFKPIYYFFSDHKSTSYYCSFHLASCGYLKSERSGDLGKAERRRIHTCQVTWRARCEALQNAQARQPSFTPPLKFFFNAHSICSYHFPVCSFITVITHSSNDQAVAARR